MLGGSRLTLSKYITGVLIKGLSRAIQGLNIFKGERKGSPARGPRVEKNLGP